MSISGDIKGVTHRKAAQNKLAGSSIRGNSDSARDVSVSFCDSSGAIEEVVEIFANVARRARLRLVRASTEMKSPSRQRWNLSPAPRLTAIACHVAP
jgi:hypothetical protein